MLAPRLLIVVNPNSLRGRARAGFEALRAALPEAAEVRGTAGDGHDVERIAAWVEALAPEVVAGAGGDGTVRAVAAALMVRPAETRPALGLVPIGTANNFARSLGVPPLGRQPGVAEALAAALGNGSRRSVDAGRANGEWFVGSCAAGMDAAILAARNRWRRRWRLGPALGGYPLYLLACAVGLGRHRAVGVELGVGGAAPDALRAHNLLVLNTALYAGEFRFDAGDRSDDGCLDLHLFPHGAAYVRGYVAAWRRHLRARGGAAVAPPSLRRITSLDARFAAPTRLQLDGEEAGVVEELAVEVVPAALRVVAAVGPIPRARSASLR